MALGWTLLEQVTRTGLVTLVTLTVQQGKTLRPNTPTCSWNTAARVRPAWLLKLRVSSGVWVIRLWCGSPHAPSLLRCVSAELGARAQRGEGPGERIPAVNTAGEKVVECGTPFSRN